VSWMYGAAGADYTRSGERATVSVKAEMGGGSF
jgi:hypothetical protein